MNWAATAGASLSKAPGQAMGRAAWKNQCVVFEGFGSDHCAGGRAGGRLADHLLVPCAALPCHARGMHKAPADFR